MIGLESFMVTQIDINNALAMLCYSIVNSDEKDIGDRALESYKRVVDEYNKRFPALERKLR